MYAIFATPTSFMCYILLSTPPPPFSRRCSVCLVLQFWSGSCFLLFVILFPLHFNNWCIPPSHFKASTLYIWWAERRASPLSLLLPVLTLLPGWVTPWQADSLVEENRPKFQKDASEGRMKNLCNKSTECANGKSDIKVEMFNKLEVRILKIGLAKVLCQQHTVLKVLHIKKLPECFCFFFVLHCWSTLASRSLLANI